MAKIRLGGSKTAHPVLKRPPAGILKSGVTSGYGGLMIPLGRIRLETLPFWCPVMMVTKNLDDVAKKWILGQKTAFLAHFGPKNQFYFKATPI